MVFVKKIKHFVSNYDPQIIRGDIDKMSLIPLDYKTILNLIEWCA
jgi:hypothetical protein